MQTHYPMKWNVHDSKWDGNLQNAKIEDIFTSGLNCVRGAAARAIGDLLWIRGDLLNFFKQTIEALVNDHHIVVRTSVIYALIPIINLDKDLAIRWFIKAVENDLRVILSRCGFQFISYTIRTHFSSIYPVIKAMIESDNVEIAKESWC